MTVDDPQGVLWPPLPSDKKFDDYLAIESAVSFRRSVIYTCVVGVLVVCAFWLFFGSFTFGELLLITLFTLFVGCVIGIIAGASTWSRLDIRDQPITPDLFVQEVNNHDDSLMAQELDNRKEKEKIMRTARKNGAAKAQSRSARVAR
jgi:hypothetical protein